MKHWKATLTTLATLLASIALADDFKTIKGKEYKNAEVSHVEPDGITIKFSGGIVKIPFTDLSEEVQRKYNYDSKAANQFAADEQQKTAALNSRIAKRVESERAEQNPSGGRFYPRSLKYESPEQLTAATREAARSKLLSVEEENAELAKVPPGGKLEVTFDSISSDFANPKWLTYIIRNSAGDVLERKQGHDILPTTSGQTFWDGFDYVELPAFSDSLRVRIYHEFLGSSGDYVIQRDGQITHR